MSLSLEKAIEIVVPFFRIKKEHGGPTKIAEEVGVHFSTLKRAALARIEEEDAKNKKGGNSTAAPKKIVTPAEEVNGETIDSQSTSAKTLDTNEEDNENQRQVS